MSKRFYFIRPCFWPSFFVTNIKLVLLGHNVSKHYGVPRLPFFASADPRNPHFKISCL